MNVTLDLILDFELFDISEFDKAKALAYETGGHIYSWNTTCKYNWLEKGTSLVNLVGFVVLPAGLPDQIDMADDPLDDNN